MTLLTFMFVPLNTFVKSTTDEGRSVIAVITAFLTLELDTGEKIISIQSAADYTAQRKELQNLLFASFCHGN